MYKCYVVAKIFFLRAMEMPAAAYKPPNLEEKSALSKDCLCHGVWALSLPRLTKATHGLGCDIHRVSHEKSLHIEIFQNKNIHHWWTVKRTFLLSQEMQEWNTNLQGSVQGPHSTRSTERDTQDKQALQEENTSSTACGPSRNPTKSLRTR